MGCLDCKQPFDRCCDQGAQAPIHERAEEYTSDPDLVRNIINEGCEKARDVARDTMEEKFDRPWGLVY